jgi:hypothetical protein
VTRLSWGGSLQHQHRAIQPLTASQPMHVI